MIYFIFYMMTAFSIPLFAGSQKPIDKKKIKVLYTAALIPDKYGERKKQYIRNLKLLKSYGCDVYVVESYKRGPTFLDDYCSHVCYTRTNDLALTKSANEAISMYTGLKFFNFDADEMIIKITGRYELKTDEFIRLVKNNPDADIIARVWGPSDAYTGLFAIKVKCLEDLLINHYLNLVFLIPNMQGIASNTDWEIISILRKIC